MVSRNDKPGFSSRDEAWKNKKSRDDTPSFIRDVQARSEMLNPNRSGETIPVLSMPKSVRLWRKIRWPLFIAIVVLLLAVIGVFTNNSLVGRSVENKIEEAAALEAAGKIDGLVATERTLAALAERHPSRLNAQAANAWHAVLLAELFGPKEKYRQAAAPSLGRIQGDTTALGHAARAGAEHLAGKDEQAIQLADQGLKAFPGEPRLGLVRAWALRALGRDGEAADAIAALRKSAPHYLPAAQFALLSAVDDGDLGAVKRYSAELLMLSPGDMIGALGSIAVRLPGWNEAPDPEQATAMLEDIATLKSHFGKAPANIGALGFFLAGRTNLASGKVAEAINDLRTSLAKKKSDKVLAWYALAVRLKDGPAAALALLGRSGAGKSVEVASITAQCHLDLHHVAAASKAVAAMESAGIDGAGELGWILAVRSGDAEKAKSTLPASIDSRLQWVGLEMHDLLRDRGDAKGIVALADRFEEKACSGAIRAWHSPGVGRLLSVFESSKQRKIPCVAALTARLMRGHITPAELRKSADAAVAASDGDFRTRVDWALAVWLTDGREAAVRVLDEIVEVKPESVGILTALSDAYLATGLPERAAEILAPCKSAECAGLRINAWRRSKTPERAAAELDAALAAGADPKAPGLAVALMERDLEAQRLDAVIATAEAVFPTAGRWAAEVAELKAKAQSVKGDRGDADRTLLAAADKVVKGVGIGESWSAKIALVRMNLDRGGNYVFKAFAVAFEMYKAGVKDAELSYSYAVANIDQGNDRGALRYLREAIDLDPSFVPAYTRLKLLDKLPDELLAQLERSLPGTQP